MGGKLGTGAVLCLMWTSPPRDLRDVQVERPRGATPPLPRAPVTSRPPTGLVALRAAQVPARAGWMGLSAGPLRGAHYLTPTIKPPSGGRCLREGRISYEVVALPPGGPGVPPCLRVMVTGRHLVASRRLARASAWVVAFLRAFFGFASDIMQPMGAGYGWGDYQGTASVRAASRSIGRSDWVAGGRRATQIYGGGPRGGVARSASVRPHPPLQ